LKNGGLGFDSSAQHSKNMGPAWTARTGAMVSVRRAGILPFTRRFCFCCWFCFCLSCSTGFSLCRLGGAANHGRGCLG
jgi:hypothetical protein